MYNAFQCDTYSGNDNDSCRRLHTACTSIRPISCNVRQIHGGQLLGCATQQVTVTKYTLCTRFVLLLLSRYLLIKYDAHINLEASASIAVVKYMFSYIYKGQCCTCGLCDVCCVPVVCSLPCIYVRFEVLWSCVCRNQGVQCSCFKFKRRIETVFGRANHISR